MKVLFHTNSINFRGTSVAVTDYARYNQTILGNESVICYDAGLGYEKDMGSETAVIDELSKEFQVIGHDHNLEAIIDREHIDFAYFIRAGQREPLPTNVKTGVHSVFQFREPHGDKYAYISSWLSNHMSNGEIPFVPHIVKLPEPNATRSAFGISNEQIIVGRYGGYYTFDIPWAQKVVEEVANSDSRFVFVFVGTEPFISHPRVIFFPEIHNLQDKSNFINMCDLMLHARQRGESFGLSIAEFLFFGKPVLAWNNGHDRNHIHLLENIGGLYSDPVELTNLLVNFDPGNYNFTSNPVADFEPKTVMTKFNEVFLRK